MNAITVRDLVKSYGDSVAVDGISFEVPEGSFFALLGPNGAGKSTTISIICSLLQKDSGHVEIFGTNVDSPEIKRSIGVVFQDPMMDKSLTVRENLTFRGSMYRLDDVDKAVEEAISAADCASFADQRYGTLSGGQRRRADIARALVHSPRLLILDEPTSGLDPHTRKTIWNTVMGLNRDRGMTVLLTTHYMEEATASDDIVIMDHGKIVAHGTPEELREKHTRDRLVMVPKVADRMRESLNAEGVPFEESRGVFTVPLDSTVDSIPIIDKMRDNLASLEVVAGTLDDAFVSITEDSE